MCAWETWRLNASTSREDQKYNPILQKWMLIQLSIAIYYSMLCYKWKNDYLGLDLRQKVFIYIWDISSIIIIICFAMHNFCDYSDASLLIRPIHAYMVLPQTFTFVHILYSGVFPKSVYTLIIDNLLLCTPQQKHVILAYTRMVSL